MKTITENYADHTKDELIAEASRRGITDVTSSSLKGDIVAALELSDESKLAPPEPLPKVALASPIPLAVAKEAPTPLDQGGAPLDEEYTDGLYVMPEGDFAGEVFALCIHPADTYGRTHSLKNSLHAWQGTKDEFKKTFEKK